jgi:hypothetical protein
MVGTERITRRSVLKRALMGAAGLTGLMAGIHNGVLLAVATDSSGWRRLAPTTSPSQRSYANMAYDASNHETVLFSGLGAANDIWSWNGLNWIAHVTGIAPPARMGAAFAFDPVTSGIILFGGLGVSAPLQDTWRWDGNTWEQLAPKSSPAARVGAVLAMDPVTGKLLMFGGQDANHAYDDTWSWTGSDWQQLAPLQSPAPTSGASLAYDPATRQLLLAGGRQSPMGVPGAQQTWTWTGTTWVLSQQPAIGRRAFAAAASDSSVSALVLFGGLTDSVMDGDTKVKTSTWHAANSSSSPSARAYAAFAYEPKAHGFLLFGGQDRTGLLADTWLFTP